VYYFLNKEEQIIYIGKSVNMYNRALSHFNSKENKGKKMLNDLYNVDYVKTGSELVALLHEAEEIKKHKPHYNRMRKADLFTHCIDWFIDDKGIINFKLMEYSESESPLLSFNTYSAARERIEQWIEDYTLCLRYCNLTSEDSNCFNHQIKKCNGICNGQEEIIIYNKRAREIIDSLVFANKHFALIDHGRTQTERSLILIENGHYIGYGYIDSFQTISSLDECKGLITKSIFYPDADNLIRGFLKNNRLKKVVFKQIDPLFE
jgi:DNA polymerase-3 subunit epsilon